jgi:hypothetical protein
MIPYIEAIHMGFLVETARQYTDACYKQRHGGRHMHGPRPAVVQIDGAPLNKGKYGYKPYQKAGEPVVQNWSITDQAESWSIAIYVGTPVLGRNQ